MDQKWQLTMEVFDEYERRFAQARVNKRAARFPEDREAVIAGVKKCSAGRRNWCPKWVIWKRSAVGIM